MKIIALIRPSDIAYKKMLDSVIQSKSDHVSTFFNAGDFKEAVRKNIIPKPIIIFSVPENNSVGHLMEIRKFVTDSILFLIVPNGSSYLRFQKKLSIYPRYIFCRDHDDQLFSSILKKMIITEERNKSVA